MDILDYDIMRPLGQIELWSVPGNLYKGEIINMRAIVFGGTGSIGKHVVQNLLEMKIEVKTFTRGLPNPEELATSIVVVGNVLDYNSVEKAVSADDIVVILLGFNKSALDTMSRGTENILKAMKAKNCKRVVCLSAQGAGESWDFMPDSFKEMVHSDPVLNASFRDHTIQESIIKASDFDWTIVRPTEVVDESLSGKKYIVNGFADDLIFQISKHDVADFIVSEITNPKYLKKVAMITC